MRRTVLAASLLALLCVLPTQSVEARRAKASTRLRALTFNIRYDFESDGRNRWQYRVDLVAQRIIESQAHVICLQEDKEDQVNDLKQRLKGYEFVGRGRNDTGSGERCSIVFQSKALKLKASGDFWLSDTPDVPGSNTWGDKYPRKATWALFEPKKGGKKTLLVVNTHLPEGKGRHADTLRTKGVEVIAAWIRGKLDLDSKKGKGKDVGILVCGDFNSEAEGSAAYTRLVAEGKLGLRDAWVEAKPADPSPGTFCGFNGLRTRDRIDWQLVSGPVHVTKAAKLDTEINGRWPSDHYAVLADLVF
ncbi:MAG: endonuclease/exonuclease/phosphatase family protein [Planctomycetota bacterium]